jgi:Fe-S-cluster-containing dehydrogenase component
MAKSGFIVDVSRCSGCKACAVACKAENKTKPHWAPGRSLNKLKAEPSIDYRRVIFTAVDRTTNTDPATQERRFVTTACYHCDNPACVPACPKSALTKNASNGVVTINSGICIGCRACQWVCPYNAPRYNSEARFMEKCTYCRHRDFDPACARTCVTKALRTHDFEDTLDDVAQPAGPPGGSSPGSANGPAQTYSNSEATFTELLGKGVHTGPNGAFHK